jgi:hypothetical protein
VSAPVALEAPLDFIPIERSQVPGRAWDCHKAHLPKPELGHEHHVTVQAWQEHFAPNGITPVAGFVWDKTTVWLPPNCHYAVHIRLVALMRQFEVVRASAPNLPETELLDRAAALKPHGRGVLADIAFRSPTMWLRHGLSLADLTSRKLWGYF